MDKTTLDVVLLVAAVAIFAIYMIRKKKRKQPGADDEF